MTRQPSDPGHLAAHDLIDSHLPLKMFTTDAVAQFSARAGEVVLDDYYQVGDGNDWAVTLTRAVAATASAGVAIRLRRMYPFATTATILSGTTITGAGNGTGFYAPPASPVRLINALSVSNVSLSNFLFDGGTTAATSAASTVRGIQFQDSTNIRLQGMTVRYCADWAVSFIRCGFVTVRQHAHTGGGLADPGGRDGLHFLDCSDVLVDGADMDTGDDCVAATTETVGSARITFRNIRGRSDIGSVCINNEEGATTFPTSDITFENISTKGSARNVVRVQSINSGTVVTNVRISNLTGTSTVNEGVSVRGNAGVSMKGVTLSNINVVGKTHGIYCNGVDGLTMTAVRAKSTTTNFDGVNLTSCVNVTASACIARDSALYGIQINACTTVTLKGCSAIDSGGLGFATSTGGGLRIVNSTDVTIDGGSFTGDPAVTFLGMAQTGNTHLVVTSSTVFGGLSKWNSRPRAESVMQMPAAAIRFKEDSGGVMSTQASFNCSVARNSIGNYTITFSPALQSASLILNATAGHPSDSKRRVITQKSATTTAVTIEVIDVIANAATYSEYVNVLVYDQP